MNLFAAADTALILWPFAILGICVAILVVLITVLRIHAFLALILAAITAGLLAGKFDEKVVPESFRGSSHWIQSVEITASNLGTTAGKIGIVIALASIVSTCLLESGAADKVVRWFLRLFGERRAGTAMVSSGYILSIPIFFDTFFMLLLPLARAMSLRTGRDYLLYVMAICCCGVVTHSLCAPHPGPLAMAESLKLDLGLTMVVGILVGILPVAGSWQVAKWLNRRMPIPVRDAGGLTVEHLKKIVEKPESELPGLLWSIVPVILPIALISAASFFEAALKNPATFSGLISALGGEESFARMAAWGQFIGNRNIALLVGTVVAMGVLMRVRRLSFGQIGTLLGPSFETAGVIILITSAGGAFGLMLKAAGVGEAIKAAVAGHEINLVLLSWLVASVIRVAQGSATVAMLATAEMVYPIISSGAGLPYHPVYIFLAIGFGAMICSWMNDSGFWVVGRLSGFTEKETLRSWTVVVTVNSVIGLVVCLVGAKLLPLQL
jgi:GntP family gluconate:H+ symporter